MTDAAQAILEIDLAAIAANWRTLQDAHPWGDVGAAIKADAYGLSADRIAPTLYAAGCRHFFVAYVHEATAVRPLVPDAMLAVLSGPIPGTELLYPTHHLTPVLNSLHEIVRCPTSDAILHIDTGMSRLGLSATELQTLTVTPKLLNHMSLRYLMTHLVSSETPDDPINRLQATRFAAARSALPPMPTSLANSSGIFLGQDFASDLARPGAALYGINPTPGRPNPMRSAVRLLTRVLAVRDIPKGATVGYNATWTARRPTRIATAALGYADGFHRAHSNQAHPHQAHPHQARAFFDGTPVPLVGRVSMDLTTYDVTDHPAVQPGAWLEVLGPHQSPDDLARSAGTNAYEVLTSLGRRFHRVYRAA